MTLANFNAMHVNAFVSKVFQSNISEVKNVDLNNQKGPPGDQPWTGNNGPPPGDQKNLDDLDKLDDSEFENVLDNFIKSLKDV